MKVIMTGLNGTVAPEVANYFKKNNVQVVQYDRSQIPVDDKLLIRSFLKEHQPDSLLHFAMGSPEWAELLAQLSYELGIQFVYISTVSVYSGKQKAPITIDEKPDSEEEYGKYKRISEELVLRKNPNAYVLRIGWQIGTKSGTNNMIDFLYKQMEVHHVVKASSSWYPSCSFLEDTASAIYEIITKQKPDIYLINSNDAFSFYEIVLYLSKIHKNLIVEKTDDFTQDLRMIDKRVNIKKLSTYIKN